MHSIKKKNFILLTIYEIGSVEWYRFWIIWVCFASFVKHIHSFEFNTFYKLRLMKFVNWNTFWFLLNMHSRSNIWNWVKNEDIWKNAVKLMKEAKIVAHIACKNLDASYCFILNLEKKKKLKWIFVGNFRSRLTEEPRKTNVAMIKFMALCQYCERCKE